MTDAIISVVVEQLATFVQQEVKLVVCVRKDVNALKSTLKMLQAVLRDAETRQIREEAIRLWLGKLKAIVYDAEDVLDEWNTQNHYSLIQGVGDDVARLHKKVCSYFLSPCFSIRDVVVRYDIGRRIKEIRERLDDVANEKEKFKLNHTQIHEEHRDRLTTSFIDVSNIYGRDHDKNVILSWLLGESSAHVMKTNVISIVGTGGFWKTTLANLVLDDGDVKKTFEKRIFVCVSDPFNLLKVAKSIIEQVTGNSPSVEETEPLLRCLCETLKGKRFLIVLDDVWTEYPNDWIPLKVACDGGAQGSWVIVTTRSKKVAELMHSKHTHNLAELSDPDSWSLFEHIAFAGRQEELLKFEEIGKQIVAKCKGVPLAIKIVGSLMCSMKTKNEWNDVLTSEIWEIEKIVKEISPSFFLSYNRLPSNLKQCFMYCAIFPKDTELCKNDLVKLWMAQGFLGSGGNRNLEKIGCDYFDDLAMHSFFQDFEKSPDGNITSCKMHDLVHDFALFLTNGECSFLEDGGQLDDINVRHLVTESLESSSIYMAKNLRTLISGTSSDFGELIKVFNQLKSIRTLELSLRITELPRQVKKLLHLRYLDLSDSQFEELPETICKLYNLQTLKLNECRKLIKLPAGIGNLLNLRHLELEDTDELNCLPRGIGRLKYLRSLCKFIVGNASNECKISELKDLCYLQGSLKITGLERVADASKAAQAELKNKSVVELEFVFASPKEGEPESSEEEESDSGRIEKDNGILENLQPHENVERLNIYCFKGSQFPSWIPNRSMSANLLKLKLKECFYIKKLPALGNLASLEKLYITEMHSVEHIGDEFYGSGVVAFPKLKKFVIDDMKQLVELSFAKIMPCLSVLQLSGCPKLRALTGLGALKSLDEERVINVSGEGEGEGEELIIPNVRTTIVEERKSSEEQRGGKLRALPDVAQVKSLETLKFKCDDSQLQLLQREEDISLPCLRKLTLSYCTSLRVIPCYLFPHTLRSLRLRDCPQLRGVQPCLPPLLEFLRLEEDVGVFSESLPIAEEEENNNYPNLKTLRIWSSKHPSLPKGFNHLTTIQYLVFYDCEFLDFDLNELKHLTMLQELRIIGCPILAKRFQSSGDDWMTILSHVPNIRIDYKYIRESNRLH